MPVTFRQSLLFTLITASLMVYCMSLYNTLQRNDFWGVSLLVPNAVNYWCELLVAFPLAFIFGGKVVPKIIGMFLKTPKNMKYKKIAMPFGMVCLMAPSMTLFVLLRMHGAEHLTAAMYVHAVVLNFIAALPAQIFLAGPAARFLFGKIMSLNVYCRKSFSDAA